MPNSNILEYSTSYNVVIYLFTIALATVNVVYDFNRISVIPLICSMAHALAIIAGWWTYTSDSSGNSRATMASVFFTYVGFHVGQVIVVMYGYFIVEGLLPALSTGCGKIPSRKTFMWIFWPLQILHIGIRAGGLVVAVVAYSVTGSAKPTDALYNLSFVHFILVSVIEIFTAYLLIALFRRSRETSIRFLGGKRLGLIRHMILSTEIRVASLSTLYVIRAGCEYPKKHSKSAGEVDEVAIAIIRIFPVALVMDCVLRRAFQLEADLQAHVELQHNVGNKVAASSLTPSTST